MQTLENSQKLKRRSFANFTTLDALLVLGLSACAFVVSRWLMKAGYIRSWDTPFITISLNWILVVIAVGDQIVRNHRFGHASRQLSWNVFLSNIFENTAWVLLSWGVGDPVIVVARWPGLIFDQIVFWQMLFSTAEAKQKGRTYVWLKYALLPCLMTVTALAIIPICFLSIVRAPEIVAALKALTGVIWLWVATGWVLQIYKNWKVGIETGRDFSFKIPILVQLYLASWILHEFFNGKTGVTMYIINGAALAINTILLIQCWHYNRLWQARI
jgi:hypothetical protein